MPTGLAMWWDLDKGSFWRMKGVNVLQGEFKQFYCKGEKETKDNSQWKKGDQERFFGLLAWFGLFVCQ